jgi:uncharacterized low-complexity protein
MKKQNVISLAVGSAFAAIALTPVAHAAENPFGAAKLEVGYQLAQADTKTKDGSCGGKKSGEAKCGADKKKDASCGADKKKEASCGADKKKDGSCGADKKKDGSCGAKK